MTPISAIFCFSQLITSLRDNAGSLFIILRPVCRWLCKYVMNLCQLVARAKLVALNFGFTMKWGLVCQKQVSRVWTSDYIPQYIWDVITCPRPWYQLLTHKSSKDTRICSLIKLVRNRFCCLFCFLMVVMWRIISNRNPNVCMEDYSFWYIYNIFIYNWKYSLCLHYAVNDYMVMYNI